MKNKVTIVGAGNVGATTTHWLAAMNISDVILLDIPQMEKMPMGKALDLMQSGPVFGFDTQVYGTNDYADTKDSDIVVVTAGVPRKPGMTREDLVQTNQRIITDVMGKALDASPNAVFIIVTNPLDTMTYLALKVSGLPRERCFGQAGVLDSARFRTFLARELNVSVENVQASVLGGHGDEMVPLVRYSTVAGVPIGELLPAERINAIVERTRKGGGEIVELLKTSAYYAPGASVAKMVEAILKDKKLVVPCSAYLNGEYGLTDICFGVTAKLGAKGIEQIYEYKLNDAERAMFDKSVSLIRGTMGALKF